VPYGAPQAAGVRGTIQPGIAGAVYGQPAVGRTGPLIKESGGSPGVTRAATLPAAPAPTQTTTAETPPSPRILAPNFRSPLNFSGGILQGLTRPVYQGVEFGKQAFGDIGKEFYDAAGPSRSFESIGGAKTLETALGGPPPLGLPGAPPTQGLTTNPERPVAAGQPLPQAAYYPPPASQGPTPEEIAAAFEQAQGLLSTDYEGPEAFDQTKYATAQGDLGQAMQFLQGLQSGGGLTATLQTGVPGLTSGMARYDAQNIMGQPGYAQSRLQAQGAIDSLRAQAARDEKAARDFAVQRDEEEQSIVDASKGFLTGRKESTLGGLDTRVNTFNDQLAADEAAFAKYQATGDFAALANLSPQAKADSFLRNPIARGNELAQQQYRSVVEKPEYAAIKNMPPLELTISDRGVEKFSLGGDNSDEELWDSVKNGKITRETFDLIQKRQTELEGRTPISAVRPGSWQSSRNPGSTFGSLYFGNAGGPEANLTLQAPDARGYIDLEEGLAASRGNMSTKNERFVLNRISELLGETERLDAGGEPFRAAGVAADLEKYLQDISALVAAKGGELTKEREAFIKKLNDARNKYDKSKRKSAFGKVLRVVGSVTTGGLTDASRNTPVLGDIQKKAEVGVGNYGSQTGYGELAYRGTVAGGRAVG